MNIDTSHIIAGVSQSALRQYVNELVDQAHSLRQWCDDNDCNPAQVSRFLNGLCGPGDKLLRAIGVAEVPVYRKRRPQVSSREVQEAITKTVKENAPQIAANLTRNSSVIKRLREMGR